MAVVVIFILTRPSIEIEDNNKQENNLLINEEENVLTFAVCWTEDAQINGIYDDEDNLPEKGLNHYLDEYTAINPDVSFQVRTIAYSEYENKLRILEDAVKKINLILLNNSKQGG